jgi:peptide/nickel transport system substrate-binding protein
MTTKTNAPGYFMNNGHTNPTTTIRKSFVTGRPGTRRSSRPGLRQEDGRHVPRARRGQAPGMICGDDREILDKAPYIWLPTPYVYTAWWPWVKNYNGELRAGAVRPGPIYARIWIDQDLKKKMGK